MISFGSNCVARPSASYTSDEGRPTVLRTVYCLLDASPPVTFSVIVVPGLMTASIRESCSSEICGVSGLMLSAYRMLSMIVDFPVPRPPMIVVSSWLNGTVTPSKKPLSQLIESIDLICRLCGSCRRIRVSGLLSAVLMASSDGSVILNQLVALSSLSFSGEQMSSE